MKLLDIFKRKNKSIPVKELYKPVLSNLWVIAFRFTPWKRSEYEVLIKEVSVRSASVCDGKIYIESDYNDPFSYNKADKLNGYLDSIECRFNAWVGFFENKDKAISEYKKLMNDWIDVMTHSTILLDID